MRCPFCKNNDDRVVDSRTSEAGDTIRRRRECLKCKRRYTSYEHIEETPLRVIKKDGARGIYDRQKIVTGILKACEKRPVTQEDIDKLVQQIEAEIFELSDREVASVFIGEQVMKGLRKLDQVAYVRFASVYREFKDVNEFMDVLKVILKDREREKGKK